MDNCSQQLETGLGKQTDLELNVYVNASKSMSPAQILSAELQSDISNFLCDKYYAWMSNENIKVVMPKSLLFKDQW